MGLDMGLTRKTSEELHYWRKANAIRGFFAELPNFQDNGETKVSKRDLIDLLERCEKVLAARWTETESEVIEDNLPPTDGFFFGSSVVDEWYWEDIESTRDMLKKLLPTISETDELYYWEWY